MKLIIHLARCTVWFAATVAFAAVNVRDFGAKGDGVSKDTTSLQKAIDAAEQQGGGTVEVPAGRYLSGTIHLKNNITLHLANGAVLLASPDNNDFDVYETLPFQSVSDKETTYFHYGLVTAENVHNIAIVGEGIIDGNRTKRGGPKTVAIKLCQHVTIRGITVQNSPNYSISFWGSDYVDVDGVRILNGYADGIDPDSCRYFRISNSYIESWDDAICPKASPSMGMDQKRPVEHLTVTNCVLRTNCSNFKFGTESTGDFRNIAVSNCTMSPRDKGRRPISGISLEAVDGANIDGVVISNISMIGVETPIFIRLGNRGRGMEPRLPGSVQNISIQNVVARSCSMTSSVTGLPGHPVRRVSIDGVLLSMDGGGGESRSLDVPEHETKYPEGNMFGQLPSFGFYGRHVEGLALTNVQARWEKEDLRPALVFDDLKDLVLDGFRTDTLAGSAPVVWFNNVADAFVRGARTVATKTFLRVTGGQSSGVTLTGNDFTKVDTPVETIDIPKSAVVEVNNATKRTK
ncbi:MAG: glycosyl hydrolase family 28 protein [Acidobacteriota bacterium]|nr:glycosyl hydrolase family 28 protein [Acidobacteriota bacterium]